MPSTATSILDGLSTSVAVKAPCRTVATSNITLAGLQTISGYTTAENDRVLVKGQTNPVDNGIYMASTGSWTRAKDADGNRDLVQGTRVLIRSSSADGAEYELTTANPIVIGTTALTFELRYGANATYDQTEAEIAAGVTPLLQAVPSHAVVGAINIERYGFDASDSTSDQSAVLQRAYDVAVQLGGGVIDLPKADFRAKITIQHPSIIFRGQGGGGGATVWRNIDATAPVTFSNASRPVYGSGLRNLRLMNRDSGTYTTTDGLVITSEATGLVQMDYLSFDDLYILNFRDNISITGRTIWNLWKEIRAEGALRDGLHVECNNNISMQKFLLCRFGNSDRHGVYINHTFADPAAGWSFDTCNFEHNAENGVRITGSGGIQAFTFSTCYLEENTNEIDPHVTNPDKSDIWIDCEYALGVNFININFLANTAPAADPDWAIYVNTDTMTQAHGSIDGCRFTSYVVGSVNWKEGCYLGKNAYGGGTTGNTFDRSDGSLDLGELVSLGVWTPVLQFGGGATGLTYSNQIGRYNLHGRTVTVTGYISLSAKGSSTGAATITDLPFASVNAANLIVPVTLSVDGMAGAMQAVGRIAPNTQTITLYDAATGTVVALDDTDFGNSSAISFSASYPL